MASSDMPRFRHCVARGVTELVGVHVADAGAPGDGLDVAVDGAPVEGLVVVSLDEQAGAGRSSPGSVVVDQADQQRVQRDRAVVVELAQRDAQPVGVAEAIHGVVAQSPELAGSHAGAREELDDEPAASVGIGSEGGHELRRGGVVEELRGRLIGRGQIPGEDGNPARGVGMVPVDDALEERAQHSRGCAGWSGGSPSCYRRPCPGALPAPLCRTRRGDARSPPPTCT